MIPLGGLGGLKFLQDTYDRQLDSFTRNPQHARDVEQVRAKLEQPMSLDDLLDDRQLLRVAMTAFGLDGEEWKRGFIEKALTEATDPESTFLRRLNNPAYTAFAEVFAPGNGTIALSPEQVGSVLRDYDKRSFELAVGDIDGDMRLSLNFQERIGGLVGGVASAEARMFRILGDVPIRTVLETALGLPSDVRKLPIEQQADIFSDKMNAVFGISDLSDLANPKQVQSVIERFHALGSLGTQSAGAGSASIALSLLTSPGLGARASQNLFLASLG